MVVMSVCRRRYIEPALFTLMMTQLLYWTLTTHWSLWRPHQSIKKDPGLPNREQHTLNLTNISVLNPQSPLDDVDIHPARPKLNGNPDCQREKFLGQNRSATHHDSNNFVNGTHGLPFSSPRSFTLPNLNTSFYFIPSSSGLCFKLGSRASSAQGPCDCKPWWMGPHCSMPSLLRWASFPLDSVMLRPAPRRIIHGFPFNSEFDLLEIKLEEMGDVTDVFVVVESNYTNHGDPKERVLLNRLQQGFLQKWHHKLVYIGLDHFPQSAQQDGWLGDELPRLHAVQQGLRQLDNILPDDLFLLTDVDEVVRAEVLWFLKLHGGFPTPLGLALWQTMYGYQWRFPSYGAWSTVAAVPVRMIRQVVRLRGSKGHSKAVLRAALHGELEAPLGTPRWPSRPQEHFAGWHCAWCLRPQDIRTKLCSAITGDFPRWGDYPNKTRLSYIRDLVLEGRWFDDISHYIPVSHRARWMPQWVKKHPEKFLYLLGNE